MPSFCAGSRDQHVTTPAVLATAVTSRLLATLLFDVGPEDPSLTALRCD